MMYLLLKKNCMQNKRRKIGLYKHVQPLKTNIYLIVGDSCYVPLGPFRCVRYQVHDHTNRMHPVYKIKLSNYCIKIKLIQNK